MTYGEQLKDPRWQRKRLEILERDNFKCKLCGDTDKQLHVHHGSYLSKMKVWEYPDDMLHSLCNECHENAELCIYEMNQNLGSMPQIQENFSLLSRLANNIHHLSEQSRDSIDNILSLSLDVAYLNYLTKNKS